MERKVGHGRSSCSKCGHSGHLTYQCRNFIATQQDKQVVLDVSSTSSESEDETPLTQLRAEELKQKVEFLKAEQRRAKKKKKSRKRSPSSSSSSSPTRSESSSSGDERHSKKSKSKKSKKEKKRKDRSRSRERDRGSHRRSNH